jgi:hypothetical protein
MTENQSEKLENFLKVAVDAGNYFDRKIRDQSIKTFVDKRLATEYIRALQEYLNSEKETEND